MTAHTHPIRTHHGARNALVAGCPACEEYRAVAAEGARQLAHAAATDEANRSMRKAGRIHWNRTDYNVAVRTLNRLQPNG